ncbi:MAG: aminotransferase class V-fold PLP-dependent enzyme [Ruminococcaceae bacterium]|nr:aminotransferase class V-fold PLP-dependent enzyme [Oscillospiraceae bacterium]
MKINKNTVYLDNAATTFPKPRAVSEAVNDCITRWCGNAGRGAHPLAMASAEEIYLCRERLAQFFGGRTENTVFTLNTTYALNSVIKGILKQGDHALCSNLEHNSVYRPLYKLKKDGIIEFDVFNALPNLEFATPDMILSSIERLVKPNTRLLVCTHASNICPVTLPIKEIGSYCKSRGIFFAVDGAQSAGIYPINMKECNIDALCLPAHKGLYGVQGCGVIILGENISLETIIEGGNGVDSLVGDMSADSPERYEAGTLSTPAIAGLRRGLEFVTSTGIHNIRTHEEKLCRQAKEGLLTIPGIKVVAPSREGSLVLFRHDAIPSENIAAELGRQSICVRAGYHCAALAHEALGTPKGGAVRASFGFFNSKKDIDKFIDAVSGITRSL